MSEFSFRFFLVERSRKRDLRKKYREFPEKSEASAPDRGL